MIEKNEREITILAPWGSIKALTWGNENNSPVLLCHGRQDTGSGFRPLVRLLPDCFFYVAVDLPGNGRSDHLPKGVIFTVLDLVQTIVRVKDYYQWKHFTFIGHSLGALIGKWYNIAYPGIITRVVELDPTPAYQTYSVKDMEIWYTKFYANYYTDNKYKKVNGGPETAPKYTYEKALGMIMKNRELKKEAAIHVLERSLDPAGDGLYRFTYDQRMKEVPRLPFSCEVQLKLYSSTYTPILSILAQRSIDYGYYILAPFVMEEQKWPNRNYSFKIVPGGHDVHINDPDCMASYITDFLLEGYRAKL